MMETEHRGTIEDAQLQKIRHLLAMLVPNNTFYSRRLEAAQVSSEISSLARFSERVPFTLRDELVEDQRVHPPYGTNLTYPLEDYTRLHQTSGTAGTPMRWLDTPGSWGWMLKNWARVYRAAAVGRTDRVFFPFSFGPFAGFWAAFETALQLGCLCVPGGGLRSTGRLRVILANGITVLCCTPTYAIRLAQVARKEGIDLADSQVRLIIVGGEPGGSIPGTRALIEEGWSGVRVADHHGMTEIGPVSYECPERAGVLHVIESNFYAELVDPETGQSVGEGETAELVLTNLGREACPLLRYRTGDLVKTERPRPCACGSYELALPGGILGRADDMICVRGINLFPSAVERVVRSSGEIAEYRVEIREEKGMAEVNIQIEAAPGCPDADQLVGQLQTNLHTNLGLRIPVTQVPRGTLPRFELKAARWVRV